MTFKYFSNNLVEGQGLLTPLKPELVNTAQVDRGRKETSWSHCLLSFGKHNRIWDGECRKQHKKWFNIHHDKLVGQRKLQNKTIISIESEVC